MSASLPRAARYQHIVFADASGTQRKAVDFNPHPPRALRPAPTERAPARDADPFLVWLMSQAGMDSSQYRAETLNRRLIACLRALRANSTAEAQSLVENDGDLLSAAINALVIGVTSFFRDRAVFDLLKEQVLPHLLATRPTLRIWSVGCSDGAELYSLAMMLDELNALHRCELLGTDCRTDAIRNAHAGEYPALLVEGISLDRLGKYFSHDSQTSRVVPSLRAHIRWRTANVLESREPGTWDLILCRNMTMYLHPDAQERLSGHLQESLRPGGFLVLGKAERPIKAQKLSAIASCIYRRDNG